MSAIRLLAPSVAEIRTVTLGKPVGFISVILKLVPSSTWPRTGDANMASKSKDKNSLKKLRW
jgi:hypothetical protein